MTQQNKPYDFSQFNRTHNNAIDLVAQAVGWARRNRKPLACVKLKPTYFDLFRKGMEILMKKPLVGYEEFEFDGVKVERGSGLQFDTIRLEYYILNNINAEA
jgi:hypothetical protein